MGLSSASTRSELASEKRLSSLWVREKLPFLNSSFDSFIYIFIFNLCSCDKTGKSCELQYLGNCYSTMMTRNHSGSFCKGANYCRPKKLYYFYLYTLNSSKWLLRTMIEAALCITPAKLKCLTNPKDSCLIYVNSYLCKTLEQTQFYKNKFLGAFISSLQASHCTPHNIYVLLTWVYPIHLKPKVPETKVLWKT